MIAPDVLSAALREAGVERLPPAGKAYLSGRILRQATEYGLAETNIAALRDVSFGAKTRGATLASFPNIGAAARAAVATSYRAMPRDWGSVTEAELASLGNYFAFRDGAKVIGPPAKVPIPAKDGGVRYVSPEEALAAGATRLDDGSWNLTTTSLGEISEWKWSYLIPGYGPYTAVKDYVGPTEESQATFRQLVSDWEGFDRLGVGERIFGPGDKRGNLLPDVVDWRKFRDDWLAGKIPGDELGGRLNVQREAANKVRKYLAESKEIDPALASLKYDKPGVDVEHSTTALQASKKVEDVAKQNWLLDWATRPGNKTVLPVIGAVPDKALWALGIAGVAAVALAIYAHATPTITVAPKG